MTERKELTRKEASELQEVRIAKFFGGQVTPRSGGGPWKNGDILTPGDNGWIVECKTTVAPVQSFSVAKSVIDKTNQERVQMHKANMALAFTLGETFDDYFVLDKRTMGALLEQSRGIKALIEKLTERLADIENRKREMEAELATGLGGSIGRRVLTAEEDASYNAHILALTDFIQSLREIE